MVIELFFDSTEIFSSLFIVSISVLAMEAFSTFYVENFLLK